MCSIPSEPWKLSLPFSSNAGRLEGTLPCKDGTVPTRSADSQSELSQQTLTSAGLGPPSSSSGGVSRPGGRGEGQAGSFKPQDWEPQLWGKNGAPSPFSAVGLWRTGWKVRPHPGHCAHEFLNPASKSMRQVFLPSLPQGRTLCSDRSHHTRTEISEQVPGRAGFKHGPSPQLSYTRSTRGADPLPCPSTLQRPLEKTFFSPL